MNQSVDLHILAAKSYLEDALSQLSQLESFVGSEYPASGFDKSKAFVRCVKRAQTEAQAIKFHFYLRVRRKVGR